MRFLYLVVLLPLRTLAQDAGLPFETTVSDERQSIGEERASSVVRQAECLTYTEQFRTLSWVAWKGHFAEVESARVTAPWQRQHEVREGARPASFVLNTGRDTVDTLGARLALESRRFAPAGGLWLALAGGADAYVDLVDSRSFVSFTDIAVTRELTRGQ